MAGTQTRRPRREQARVWRMGCMWWRWRRGAYEVKSIPRSSTRTDATPPRLCSSSPAAAFASSMCRDSANARATGCARAAYRTCGRTAPTAAQSVASCSASEPIASSRSSREEGPYSAPRASGASSEKTRRCGGEGSFGQNCAPRIARRRRIARKRACSATKSKLASIRLRARRTSGAHSLSRARRCSGSRRVKTTCAGPP